MSHIRVAVIRGGASPLYDASLKTGAAVLAHLAEHRYQPIDVLIDKGGAWHAGGLPISPEKLAWMADVAFNALHGEGADDGEVNRFLSSFGVKATGAKSLGGAVTFNKVKAKERLKELGIKTPRGSHILDLRRTDAHAIAGRIFREIAPPWIIKPVKGGHGLHAYRVDTFPELVSALEYFSRVSEEAIVEEFVTGREIVFGGIEGFRGKDHYPLIPLSVKRPKGIWHLDEWHESHYEPAHHNEVGAEIRSQIDEYNAKIRNEFAPGDYYTVDAIIGPRGLTVLEVNSQPALHEHAPFPAKLKAVGATMPEFLDHVISSALGRKQ